MMKTQVLSVVALGFLVFSLPLLAQQDVAREFHAIEPGLDYAPMRKAEGPLSVHVLRVERGRRGWEWTTALSEGRIVGLSPVSTIVKMTADWLRVRPVAAINGDWFEIAPGHYQGDPRGLQIVEGEIVSAPTAYTCFWIDTRGELRMGSVVSRLRAVWPDGKAETPIGLNERRPDDRAVLYTPAFGHHPSAAAAVNPSTQTVAGRELILERAGDQPWLPLQAGQTYPVRVARVRETGNAPLDPHSVILSLGPQLLPKLPPLAVGDRLTLRMETVPDLLGVRMAIAGGPHLIHEGQLQALDRFARDRQPRSMVGWNRTQLFLAVVDGRQPKLSVGMTYQELAALASELGCTEAMALDGGGSSTLWADGRVLNSPSDGAPRSVANALILVERKPGPRPR